MSTILKALRRLEQEKSTRADRPLGEAVAGGVPVAAPQAAATRRWPMVAGIAVGVVVLGAAGFAAFQWSRGGTDSAPVEVAAVPVEAETSAAREQKAAASARAKAKKPNANRLSRQARNRRTEAGADRKLPPQAAAPEVTRSPQQSTATIASAAAPGTPDARPGESPVKPSSGKAPVIDLSHLEALQAAAKSAGKKPETIDSKRVAPTPPAKSAHAETAPAVPPPAAKPEPPPAPAPVEVAVARPAPEPPPPARRKPAKSEPPPKVEPKPEPVAEPEPPRSFARKSPPRPSVRPRPKIYVSRTVWHPDVSRRVAYVKLEGRDETVALREGESIGPLIVTEIAPTGVSFDDRGNEFKRRVGAR